MIKGRQLRKGSTGVGNVWKSEGCFAAGVDPWRPTGEVTDAEAVAIVQDLRPRMQRSAADGSCQKVPAVPGASFGREPASAPGSSHG